MAYEVTATRRRPQRFEDMIGQEFVVATLQKSITTGKIAHAYLFSGPRGCGKTSSARILAKALNCEKGLLGSPCGICDACSDITRGSSLDVIEIDGASNTSVNDVRQIKEEVQFPPNSCRYKVYIIDEVHMLSTSAFNALLKTIEEPPPYVIFIFATTELHKVPATIKSRCQQFNFRLVSVEKLKDVLVQTVNELGIQADDEALFWIAREATGSVRDAYTLFDQVAAFSEGKITFDKIRDKLGLIGVDRLNPVVEFCVAGESKQALLLLDEILQNGVSVEQCIIDLADYFRNALLIKAGIDKESLLGQKAERFSKKVIDSWSSIQIERALSIVFQVFRDIRYSLDPRYELDLAISRISWLSDYVSLPELKHALVQTRKMLSGNVKVENNPFDYATCQVVEEKQVAKEILVEESLLSPIIEPEPERIANPFAEFKRKIGAGHVDEKKVKIQNQEETQTWLADEQKIAMERVQTEIEVQKEFDEPGEEPIQTVNITELQESLVHFFLSGKNMIAAAIQQSFDWKEDSQCVSFSVDKPFTYSFLEQENHIIKQTIIRLLGKQIDLKIELDTSKIETVKNQKVIPERVEIIKRMFRGTLI